MSASCSPAPATRVPAAGPCGFRCDRTPRHPATQTQQRRTSFVRGHVTVPRPTPSRAARTNPRRVRRAVVSIIGDPSCPASAHTVALRCPLEGHPRLESKGAAPGHDGVGQKHFRRQTLGCLKAARGCTPSDREYDSRTALGIRTRAASFYTRRPRVSCRWVCKKTLVKFVSRLEPLRSSGAPRGCRLGGIFNYKPSRVPRGECGHQRKVRCTPITRTIAPVVRVQHACLCANVAIWEP